MSAALHHPQASQRRYSGDYDAHDHPHAQLLFGLRGSLDLCLAGRAARVEAGTALVVPAGVAHGYRALQPALMLVVDAPPQPGLDRVRQLALDLRPLPSADELDVQALLDALPGAPRVLARRRLDLQALADTVDAALHQPWPTQRLAALACLSAPRFHTRVQQQTGLTPQDWLRARRLDRAQALLAAGHTLQAAATRVGYASASALAYALRRERGLGARALRGTPLNRP